MIPLCFFNINLINFRDLLEIAKWPKLMLKSSSFPSHIHHSQLGSRKHDVEEGGLIDLTKGGMVARGDR